MQVAKVLECIFSHERTITSGAVLSLCIVFASCFPMQAQSVSDRINKLLFTENYDRVISILDSVKQKDSLNNEAHYKISLAYQNLYLHDKAIMHLLKARSLAGDSIKILSALGKSYLTLGAYDKAQEQYEAALVKDSANNVNAFMLAKVFVEQALFTRAIDIYQSLFLKDPTNS